MLNFLRSRGDIGRDGSTGSGGTVKRSAARTMGLALMLLIIVMGLVGSATSEGLRVRLGLLGLMLSGRLDGVRVRDLPPLLRPSSGFNLPHLVQSRNAYAALQVPERAMADSAGSVLFRARCSSCHGSGAEGGVGPSLVSGELRRGTTDWAMYRVIQDGVPGTPMRPTGLTFPETWKVIAYLRNLQHQRQQVAEAALRTRLAPLTTDEIAAAGMRDDDWAVYGGDWSGRRHKEVPEFTAGSIPRLALSWALQINPDPVNSQSTPIAVRGLVLVTSVMGVIAASQETGDVVWRFFRDPGAEVLLCCGRANRGVAVYGNLVFYPTLDAHLIALDLSTGRVVWDVTVAQADKGYSMSGAPLVADGKVIVGVGGGEFAIRGFVDAYDPATGTRLWRFHTVPLPGEPGGETWPTGRAARGGGSTWVTGAYDPKLRLLYWGVGNPSPDFAPDLRPGDNLHTESVVALDIESGTLRWSYQFTPNDSHDWDATQQPVLVDALWEGTPRQLLLWANRNGFFYVLDRVTGTFLRGTPFVRQNWNDGFDADGRPRVRPGMAPSPGSGTVVYPSVGGATTWWPPAFSPELDLFFVPARDMGSVYFREEKVVDGAGQVVGGRAVPVGTELPENAVLALDLHTGQVRWRARLSEVRRAWMGGLLSVGDRLVVGGYGPYLFIYDARTGTQLWARNLGATIAAPPVVFRVAGAPRLGVMAGSVFYVFELADAAQKQRPSDGRPHDFGGPDTGPPPN